MKTIKSEESPPYGPVVPDVKKYSNDLIINQALVILENRLKNKVPEMKVTCPKDAIDYLTLKLSERGHEVFAVMFLDTRHQLIEYAEMFSGTIDGASVYPREVAKAALQYNAAAVILAHNHPSGVPDPSQADEHITIRLKDGLGLLEIKVLDHIIIGGNDHVSLAERGIL